MEAGMLATLLYFIFNSFLNILFILVTVRAILSWFPLNGAILHLYEIVHVLTEPLLKPVRKLLMKFKTLRSLPIDFSPIVLLFILGILNRILVFLLRIGRF